MLYNLEYDKVYLNMANKFEKMLSCEQVVLLKIKDDKLVWLNARKTKKSISNNARGGGQLELRDKLIYECYTEN